MTQTPCHADAQVSPPKPGMGRACGRQSFPDRAEPAFQNFPIGAVTAENIDIFQANGLV
jgi:hypothetical protein